MVMGLHIPLPVFLLLVSIAFGLEFRYHSNEEIEQILESFVKETTLSFKYLTAEKYVIGQSKRGYNLSVISLSSIKTNGDWAIPNVKLIGNVHGNEPVGRVVLLHFLYFLRENYGKNDDVSRLLNSTKIHVMPTMNPDGFDASVEGCETDEIMTNSQGKDGVDLNSNFPVLIPPHKNKIPQARETKAVIDWMDRVPFILSAAMHGEAMVVRYPYDTISEPSSLNDQKPEITADNDVFVHLATVYSKNNPIMVKDKPCNFSNFENGIINGAQFNHRVYYDSILGIGTMQDYNYEMQGCMEVSLEISCCQYPEEGLLPWYWEKNKLALLKYSLEANRGIVGKIVDGYTEEPIGGASIVVMGRNIVFKSRNGTGAFWRLLLDGKYTIKVSAKGYYSELVNFTLKQHFKDRPKLLRLPIIYLWNESLSTTTTTESTTTTIPTKSSRLRMSLNISTITLSTIIQHNFEASTEVLKFNAGSNICTFSHFYYVIFAILVVLCFRVNL